MTRDFSRKVLISHFLPFGFIGSNALTTAMKTDPISGMIYDPTISMSERQKRCDRVHISNLTRLGYMERGYYIAGEHRKYDNAQTAQFFCYSLTKSGLFLLTGTQDVDTEKKRLDKAYELQSPQDRDKKEIINYTPSAFVRDISAALYDYQTVAEPSEQERADYEKLFFYSVREGVMTPLASYMAEAVNTSVNLNRLNGKRQFQLWRIGNINAMFRAAGMLSMLDRRPMMDKWTFNGYCSGRVHKHAPDIPTLTSGALTQWYKNYPDCYLYDDPKKSLEENREAWLATPTFYGLHELPEFELDLFKDNNPEENEQKNVVRHTCLGVGIGSKINYILYHTKSKKMRWNSGIERSSASKIQEAINKVDLNEPVFGAGRVIQNAMIFCDTIYQFAAIFDEVIKLKKYYYRINPNFGYPFHSVHIILLNGAGVHQLTGLMRSTPVEFNREMARKLKELNPEFMDTGDLTYPLAYNNRPVFFAYVLDYFQLCRAIEDRRSGKTFYVACYPEQVKFLLKILPDVEFL